MKQAIKWKKWNLEASESKINVNSAVSTTTTSSSEEKIFRISLHLQEIALFNKKLKFILKSFENDMKKTVSFLTFAFTDHQCSELESNLNQMKQMKQRMKQQMNNKMSKILNILKKMRENER